MRALVVDDHAEVCAAICAVLRHSGLTATAAASSPEAVALLARSDFDVLLVDLWLDGNQSGLDIAWAATARGLGCVVMSGAADCRDQVEALGFRFLAKPFWIADLLTAVRESVE